ncbi:CAZyme family CE10 [Penicillium coprophilum]|uniref:CAZyme family CE10 n=1 Tax=Penicillium coprophilum TaxID=36646 RepID=UPI0023A5B3F0|nr:CAZyme family CE10 [Penicillium coprophilum]KAJ5164309.1 CAZyme family CE10 [Penicillium coprophilum]
MASTSPPPSRATLSNKAHRYRILSSLLSLLDRYLSWPLPPRPSIDIAIPSKISKAPGSIQLYFFTAPSNPLSPRKQTKPIPPRPVLINFHGGGFSIGHALDDARWAGYVLKAYPDTVVVSLDYRLAPEHPFPVALEDGVDAILWLWQQAQKYNLDKTRFVLSGFSAGGNLALAVPFRLHEELQKKRWTSLRGEIALAGLVVFYPSTDWTRTRIQRNATNPIAAQKSMISPSMFNFFDNSYLVAAGLPKRPGTDRVDMSHPFLSPGLAPASLLSAAYPHAVAIYTCGWDQLLVEGNTFRERLGGFVEEGRTASVGGFVVEDVVHGFDKKPSFWKGSQKRERMYADAIKQLKMMWKVD